MKQTKILIAGEGGQGIQALAMILIKSYFEQKKKVVFLPNFGVEQRGGVSLAFVQISDILESFPKFGEADIVVLFSPRAIKRIENYFGKETLLIFDNSLVPEKALSHFRAEKMAIPATHMAKEKLVPRVFNTIMLGALVEEIGGAKNKVFESKIAEYFGDKIKKEPQLKHFNIRAFELGQNTAKLLKKDKKWYQKIQKA